MIKVMKLLFILLLVFIRASSHDGSGTLSIMSGSIISWVLAETQSPGRRALAETNTTIAPVPASTSVKASGVPASTRPTDTINTADTSTAAPVPGSTTVKASGVPASTNTTAAPAPASTTVKTSGVPASTKCQCTQASKDADDCLSHGKCLISSASACPDSGLCLAIDSTGASSMEACSATPCSATPAKCQCNQASKDANNCFSHGKCVISSTSVCPDSSLCFTSDGSMEFCSATPCTSKSPNGWIVDQRAYHDSGCTRSLSLKSGGSVLTQKIPMNTCMPVSTSSPARKLAKYLSYKCENHKVEDSKMVVIEQSYEDSNCSVQGTFRKSYKRGVCSGPVVLGKYVIATWSGKTPCGGISAEPQATSPTAGPGTTIQPGLLPGRVSKSSSSNILFVGLSFLFSFIYLL